MMPPHAPAALGTFRVVHDGPFVAGMRTVVHFEFEVGEAGLAEGAKFRVGLPNTGWDAPVVPQQRYWDELVTGAARRLAPFYPVNTTAIVQGREGVGVVLTVMERMLVPDEDPAFAYWRWWITASIEGGKLRSGDVIRITYGEPRFTNESARIQTYVEDHINIVAFIQGSPDQPFLAAPGSPFYFDVIPGPPSRANVVAPSTHSSDSVDVRISLTDECHCQPAGGQSVTLDFDGAELKSTPGASQEIRVGIAQLPHVRILDRATGRAWGRPNPSIPAGSDGLQLYWGDLHAQSEHHVMHSQKKDFRQEGWSKGISNGTVDDCYAYAREVSLLDFMAITDQGVSLTPAWELCQGKVREYHEPGRFVTFKGYEGGAPIGHRNVIYGSDEIEPPLDAVRFSNFHPPVLYDYYRDRRDAILIPHHVKTWTDWNYHDPELEPLMEIYSCWGQSESPSLELWNKGMTPGAGAWAAFNRGYRMGLIASSDNHVGLPGRSYPGDRQAHTPFKGGLCAIWAESLTRESLFSALKQRRCYGTTGARIIVRFSIAGQPMGSAVTVNGAPLQAAMEVHGTHELKSVELVTAGRTVQSLPIARGADHLSTAVELSPEKGSHFYLRIAQFDGERAWTSPIFFD